MDSRPKAEKKKLNIDTQQIIVWILLASCLLISIYCIREKFRMGEELSSQAKEIKSLETTLKGLMRNIEDKIEPLHRKINEMTSERRIPPSFYQEPPLRKQTKIANLENLENLEKDPIDALLS